ncbi:6-phosphogluconate dehydratase [Dongia mobilis]|uniref:Phosphogluconate dehydratase n=1 Tax=Dongia mobilis TaxID=578943 RepID=A0A4V3DF11_9PROT|nr:phosphogluconate dehydratase [Dongia mobilis]TDQ84271.1 6-phosphogluconate dehydratase [Dongia mobilis]
MHPTIQAVTERIRARSLESRAAYLERVAAARGKGVQRARLSCGNLAHGYAACSPAEKEALAGVTLPNLGIVSAYNDMLSAHQPLKEYPEIIRQAVAGQATAQFAGGVPAMCDGVTQGQAGMELSLFSRDVIAMATAVSLSHDMFDAALMLGVCDKIVPGLLIGALAFGHLPTVFVPAGPMPSGLPNAEKSRIRQLYAEGKVGRQELLAAESASYHAPGTCTFYGTANSNQMLMELMGLHLPGAAFVNPGTPLRAALTAAAAKRVAGATALGNDYRPIGEIVDEKAIVNAIVGLTATGGSTNHTIHLIAVAAAAGIRITWADFAEISGVTPLLCRIYPNGQADVNHFQAAGGFGFLVRELIDAGLLHRDVKTLAGDDLSAYAEEPWLDGGRLKWRAAPADSLDKDVLRPVRDPFALEGGIRVLGGNLGAAIIKVSAVKPAHRVIEAPAMVFSSQEAVKAAFKEGRLHRDVIVVVKGQGPRANGMPELHQLTPALGVLLDLGYKVALLTDGRMSGASGKVPAAIHLSPEAAVGGPIARIRDGDIIRLDTESDQLTLKVDAAELAARAADIPDLSPYTHGCGRELFAGFRAAVGAADAGAASFGWDGLA